MTADWIINLGSGGGYKGGEIVATSTAEQVVRVERSYAGRYLEPLLGGVRASWWRRSS